MTAGDYVVHAALVRRVIERTKATPELNLMSPQEALVAVLEMIEHEYRHAHEIMPVED